MKTVQDMTKEYRSSIGVKFALSGGLGLLNTTFIHTPASAYVNEFLNRMMNKDQPHFKETPWTKVRIFNGLPAHNMATITMVGCSITTNDYICKRLTLNGYQLNYQDKYFISILSGAFAGIASPIEAVAQAQQRQSVHTPLTTMQVVKSIYKNNGITAFSRGMAATVGRSAGFTSGYLGLMPLIVDTLREQMGDTPLVYLIAGVLSGSIVGTMADPTSYRNFAASSLC